jgi:site-specific DNA-methyltransferase (adenine-specific)
VAQNVLEYGTGAINIDGCRVQYVNEAPPDLEHWRKTSGGWKNTSTAGVVPNDNSKGRWPANLILTYAEDEYMLRHDVTTEQQRELYAWLAENA